MKKKLTGIMKKMAARTALAITIALAAMPAYAETLIWTIEPQYQDMQRFVGDYYIFKSNGKYGLRTQQKVELPAQYDFITPFYNGYSLVGEKHGDRLLLRKIIDERNGSITTLSVPYLLSPKYPVFSDGLLIVMNQKSKYGYIAPSGAEVVKCQYQDALPYKEGYMSVKQKLWRIVRPSGNPAKPQVLIVNFNNNDMTAASPFSGGRAAVAYNDDYAMVNKAGERSQKITASDFKRYYKDFCELTPVKSAAHEFGANLSPTMASFQDAGGLYGVISGSRRVVEPQFESLSQVYADNTAIAKKDGKYGMIRIVEGDISSDFRAARGSGVECDRDGNVSNLIYEVKVPQQLGFEGGRIMIDRGDGIFADLTSSARVNGATRSVEFRPILADANAKEVKVRARVGARSFDVPERSETFKVSHPAALRISGPGPATVRANEKNICTVSATIHNQSSLPVTLSTSWGGSITIPAHGSKTLYKSFANITSTTVKSVSISLSTGEHRTSSITFIPYF